VFEVVATGGDAALGGDDFDHRWPTGRWRQARRSAATRATQRRAGGRARAAKEALSDRAQRMVAGAASAARHAWW
jgi:molecular chaperone HscA